MEDVELFLVLVPPKEFIFPAVGVVNLLREIPTVLEEDEVEGSVEFSVNDFGGLPGDGTTMGLYKRNK